MSGDPLVCSELALALPWPKLQNFPFFSFPSHSLIALSCLSLILLSVFPRKFFVNSCRGNPNGAAPPTPRCPRHDLRDQSVLRPEEGCAAPRNSSENTSEAKSISHVPGVPLLPSKPATLTLLPPALWRRADISLWSTLLCHSWQCSSGSGQERFSDKWHTFCLSHSLTKNSTSFHSWLYTHLKEPQLLGRWTWSSYGEQLGQGFLCRGDSCSDCSRQLLHQYIISGSSLVLKKLYHLHR